MWVSLDVLMSSEFALMHEAIIVVHQSFVMAFSTRAQLPGGESSRPVWLNGSAHL